MIGILLADFDLFSIFIFNTVFFILLALLILSQFLFKKHKSILIIFLSNFFFLFFGYNLHYYNDLHIKKEIANTKNAFKFSGEVNDISYTKSGKIKLELKVHKSFFKTYKKTTDFKLFAYCDSNSLNVSKSDVIFFKSKINEFEFFNNPWDFDYGRLNRRNKILGYVFLNPDNSTVFKTKKDKLDIQNIRMYLNELLKTNLKGQELEVCKAFLWGDRSGVDKDVMSSFSNTGTIHILAVSGLHIGLLFTIVISFFKIFSFYITKKQATIFAILIAWIYAYVCGFSPSILRSVIVFTLLFYNDLIEKKKNELMLLSFSALILLIFNSNYLFDLGFQLTYSALLGIFTLNPLLSKLYVFESKLLNYFYQPMILGISAQITTLPIVLYNFHQFPNYFLIVNLLLVPFSFLILFTGLLFYVFSFSVFLKFILGKFLTLIVYIMISIVDFFNKLPFSVAKQFDFNVVDFVFVVLFIVGTLVALKKKVRLYTILLISSIVVFGVLLQYKRYNSINEEYLAKIGGSKNDYIIKQRSKIYFICSNKKSQNYLFSRIRNYFQGDVFLINNKQCCVVKIGGKNISLNQQDKKNNAFKIINRI